MPRQIKHLPPPPPSLDRAHRAKLTAVTERALLRRRRHLAEAIDMAFDHVPRPLRGVVRRALGA